jgi:hypothetical protein
LHGRSLLAIEFSLILGGELKRHDGNYTPRWNLLQVKNYRLWSDTLPLEVIYLQKLLNNPREVNEPHL